MSACSIRHVPGSAAQRSCPVHGDPRPLGVTTASSPASTGAPPRRVRNLRDLVSDPGTPAKALLGIATNPSHRADLSVGGMMALAKNPNLPSEAIDALLQLGWMSRLCSQHRNLSHDTGMMLLRDMASGDGKYAAEDLGPLAERRDLFSDAEIAALADEYPDDTELATAVHNRRVDRFSSRVSENNEQVWDALTAMDWWDVDPDGEQVELLLAMYANR